MKGHGAHTYDYIIEQILHYITRVKIFTLCLSGDIEEGQSKTLIRVICLCKYIILHHVTGGRGVNIETVRHIQYIIMGYC